MPRYHYIAIVGSRDYPNLEAVRAFVRGLDPSIDVVVSGGARGVDRTAELEAELRGVHTVIIRANWKRYPKIAGHMRNPIIVDSADEVVAFQYKNSSGTQGTIDEARRVGKPLRVFGYFPDHDEGICHCGGLPCDCHG